MIIKNSSTPPFLAIVFILCYQNRLVSSIISTQRGLHGIGLGDIINDGETLVSENGMFVLGFFDLKNDGKSTEKRYLGLWTNFSTDRVVWVANRENPVTYPFASLQLMGDGNLIISQNGSSTDGCEIVWSSNSSNSMGGIINPIAKLLNSGNLIITNGTDGDLIWQSFDYPTDTLFPGMKIGFNKQTGHEWYLTAWKYPNDPSPGEYVVKMDSNSGLHEIYSYINKKKHNRFGIWNGKWFVGYPEMNPNALNYDYPEFKAFFVSTFIDNENEVFYQYHMINDDIYNIKLITNNHTFYSVFQFNRASRWVYEEKNIQICSKYNLCGSNRICSNIDPHICKCFDGYHPKSDDYMSEKHYSMGCQRNQDLSCRDDEGFLHLQDVKTPETTNTTFHKNLSIEDCKVSCMNNCSCMAFAPLYLENINPRGCIMWYSDLIDTVLYTKGNGGDLFLRLPKSELPKQSSGSYKNTIIILAMVATGLIIISLFGMFIFIRKKKKMRKQTGISMDVPVPTSYDVPLFDFSTLAMATNNFSRDNKIGQGGFGVVYKGTMEDGQEIAVKRLSKHSVRGLDDFMNEATLIAKLQHRNLLRLLGCCVQGNEVILIYEFMKNKSLDTFVFGENKHLLDWPKRVKIIKGIAKGLLYLHQDSRLRIIHRDLKPGNILLDEMMNPKISDFGTTRLFGSEQLEENTTRVIGTYGYMSPEYANGGIFSIKSDVFSFGVLLLEIISGKKNMSFLVEQNVNLLELAWTLGREGKSIILLDEILNSSCSIPEVSHMIKIGLLCVQRHAIDRPTMSDVFDMLSNESLSIKEAKKPAYCKDSSDLAYGQNYTNNTASLTTLDGR